ncbi:MAG: hypothetical protein AAGD34_06430 [Pseudomonadota bacterium]
MAELALDGASTRESLVQRLFGAFAMQVRDIEKRIAEHGGAEIVEDTKVLSGLARTLETLIALDKKVSGEGTGLADAAQLRAEIAERLARMKPPRRRKASPKVSADKAAADAAGQ